MLCRWGHDLIATNSWRSFSYGSYVCQVELTYGAGGALLTDFVAYGTPGQCHMWHLPVKLVASASLFQAEVSCHGAAAQVERWGREALMEFWSDWYFPANATLYIVGQLDRSVDETRELIARTFGAVPAGRERRAQPEQTANGASSPPGNAVEAAAAASAAAAAAALAAASAGGGAGPGVGRSGDAASAPAVEALPPLKKRHAVRRR